MSCLLPKSYMQMDAMQKLKLYLHAMQTLKLCKALGLKIGKSTSANSIRTLTIGTILHNTLPTPPYRRSIVFGASCETISLSSVRIEFALIQQHSCSSEKAKCKNEIFWQTAICQSLHIYHSI